MSAKDRRVRIGFVGLVILVILACNLPGGETPQAVKTPSMTSVALPTKPRFTPTSTNTPLSPEQNLDDTLTFGGAATDTVTPTQPLPDFDDVLTFGGTGGIGECDGIDAPNTIYIPSVGPRVGFENSTHLCITFLGMDFNKPFHLRLTAPDGKKYISPELFLNQNIKKIQWEGYQGFGGDAEWSGNGILYVGISIWWPQTYSEGQWKVEAYGENFLATGYLLFAREAEKPYIMAADSRAETQVMPASYKGLHPIALNGHGKIEVVGEMFPPHSNIYVLLYNYISSSPRKVKLFQTLSVISDSSGSIKAEFEGPFEEGQSYLLIGLSNPNTPLNGAPFNSSPDFPSDFFLVGNVLATLDPEQPSSSCPGAPAQRMAVNQRGYVCTQTYAVRLRSSPNRSASTIVQLDKGTQFTVIGGPSCADNWSWWQVKTDLGQTGWISEGGDETDPYFICPTP